MRQTPLLMDTQAMSDVVKTLAALGVGYLLGYLVVPLAGSHPVLSGYPGALLGALGVSFSDPAQVLEILLGHRGRGHFLDTSVGSGLVQFQACVFTVDLGQLNIPQRGLFPWLSGYAKVESPAPPENLSSAMIGENRGQERSIFSCCDGENHVVCVCEKRLAL